MTARFSFKFLLSFFTSIYFFPIASEAAHFSADEIEEMQGLISKKSYFTPEFNRPAPNFIHKENNPQLIVAAFAHKGDDLPYAVAVKAGLTDVVAEISEIETGEGTALVSKFVKMYSTESQNSEATENFLTHTKIAHALEKGYGTLTFRDLLIDYSVDLELARLLIPILDVAAVQRAYLFNYLVNQQDFNFTNCLFELNLNAKIKPVVIDLERAFTHFPCSRGTMYDFVFKEALDQPLSEENHSVINSIVTTNWEDITGKLDSLAKNRESDQFMERIKILSASYSKDPNSFSVTQLFKDSNLLLY